MVACEEEGGLSLRRNLVTPVMEESDEPLPFSLESKRPPQEWGVGGGLAQVVLALFLFFC